MNKERLLRLADFLEKEVPEKKFNMKTFFSDNVNSLYDLQHKCGTTACALGWMCVIPEFRALGWNRNVRNGLPALGNLRGFDAANHFFDISIGTSRHFFDFDGYDENGDQTDIYRHDERPRDVARRIRAYVAKHDKD